MRCTSLNSNRHCHCHRVPQVHNIHKNCKELLNVNHQQAGIEIMEEMYMYQLSGYERYVQNQVHVSGAAGAFFVFGRECPPAAVWARP